VLRREVRWLSLAAGILVVLATVLLITGDAGARAFQRLIA
jgi:hypothetical protein